MNFIPLLAIKKKEIPSSEQFKELESLFKKLSSGYLTHREGKDDPRKDQLRNYLYNLFFCDPDGPLSDD